MACRGCELLAFLWIIKLHIDDQWLIFCSISSAFSLFHSQSSLLTSLLHAGVIPSESRTWFDHYRVCGMLLHLHSFGQLVDLVEVLTVSGVFSLFKHGKLFGRSVNGPLPEGIRHGCLLDCAHSRRKLCLCEWSLSRFVPVF